MYCCDSLIGTSPFRDDVLLANHSRLPKFEGGVGTKLGENAIDVDSLFSGWAITFLRTGMNGIETLAGDRHFVFPLPGSSRSDSRYLASVIGDFYRYPMSMQKFPSQTGNEIAS